MKFLSIIFSLLFITFSSLLANVKFVQITDPHLFEADHKVKEGRNSLIYFYLGLEQANKIEHDLRQNGKPGLDFILCTGDLGIEKLLQEEHASEEDTQDVIIINGKRIKLTINKAKWKKALDDLAHILQDSEVKTWLFVPGNNDIYEDIPSTICFYEQFLIELQEHPIIKEIQMKVVDFRLESKQKVNENNQPGVYKIGDLAFIGWDNSYFKNQGIVDSFVDHHGKLKPKEETLAYQRIEKLSQALQSSKAKYAYIFLHIPEVDDPWLASFDKDKADPENPVYKRMKKAQEKSQEAAEDFYPYSSWYVPTYIRKAWENVVMNKDFDRPEVMGLFTGHLHDKNKLTYMGFHWLKTHVYQTEVLNKLFICPTVSIKNQASYLLGDECARGVQYIQIDSTNGKVNRKLIWLDKA